jgi:PhoH-like ATPase
MPIRKERSLREKKLDRKLFVIDTSVLIYHEDSIHAFPGQDVVIPLEVLEEIDDLKVRQDPVGNAARYINRFLDKLRSEGNLSKGVLLKNGQKISISLDSDISLMPKGVDDSRDNRIITVALKLKADGLNPTLISRDINLRVRCDALGVSAESYHKEKAVVKRRDAYTGVKVIHLSPEQVTAFYDKGYTEYSGEELMPNEYLVIKGGSQSALAVHKGGELRKLAQTSRSGFDVMGIKPRNKEQCFALEMLLDPDVHMATLTGMAGCGKTILSTAAAIHMLKAGLYDKIVLSRPVQSLSGDIGFLPGTKYEKMEPWIQPVIDNLKLIFKNGESYLQMMMETGAIEVEALTYIRGRSLPRTIFILDESQNITYAEAKAVITRMGENSKLILLGDLEQIDAPHLDSTTCGLGAVVEKFRDFHLSGHITLLKGERSPLAAYAAKIL